MVVAPNGTYYHIHHTIIADLDAKSRSLPIVRNGRIARSLDLVHMARRTPLIKGKVPP